MSIRFLHTFAQRSPTSLSRRQQPARRSRKGVHSNLAIETLEDRTLLASTFTPAVGEVADIIGRNAATGSVVVGQSNGNSFINQAAGNIPAGADWDDFVTGDFNGDGLTDLAGRSPSDGYWRVLLSTSAGLDGPNIWGRWSTRVSFNDILVGDFNGDGKDDVAGRASTGTWVVSLSHGTGFTNRAFGAWSTTAGFSNVIVGDFDNDGRDDIAGVSSGGRWVVGISLGTRFDMTDFGAWSTNAGFHDIVSGDFDGDGRTDIAALSRGGSWVVGTSHSSKFTFTVFGAWSINADFDNIRVGDFDADGQSDIAGLSKSGAWVVAASNGLRFTSTVFGRWSTTANFQDVLASDFNGDGRTDLAARSASGSWVVGLSDGSNLLTSGFSNWSGAVNWDNVNVGNFAGGSAQTGITIDGDFSDWIPITNYSDPVDDQHDTDHDTAGATPAYVDHPDVDLLNYKVTHDNENFYFYFEARGQIGRTQMEDVAQGLRAGRYYVIVTIDVDNDDVTGYPLYEGGYYTGTTDTTGYDMNGEIEFYNGAFNTGHYLQHGARNEAELIQAFADQSNGGYVYPGPETQGPFMPGFVNVLPGTYDYYTQWVYKENDPALGGNDSVTFVQDRGPVIPGNVTYAISSDGHKLEMKVPFKGFLVDANGDPIVTTGKTVDLSFSLEASGELSNEVSAANPNGIWASDTAEPINGYLITPVN
ncbi:MAG: VCBS repeat-containing protein [Planctomycetaceae bacterium]|nr:VCBS repeat-containing protein [Planctomycetaceae bacterium]